MLNTVFRFVWSETYPLYIKILNETDGWKWKSEDLWPIKLDKWKEQYSILGRMLSTVSQNPEEKESGVWQSIQRQSFRIII